VIFPQPSKIVCVGKSDSVDARELGNDLPIERFCFKNPQVVGRGPSDAVELPLGAEKRDYKVRLGVKL